MPKSTARVARYETEWSCFFTKSSKRRGAFLLDTSNPPAKKSRFPQTSFSARRLPVRLEGDSEEQCPIFQRQVRILFPENTAKPVRDQLRRPFALLTRASRICSHRGSVRQLHPHDARWCGLSVGLALAMLIKRVPTRVGNVVEVRSHDDSVRRVAQAGRRRFEQIL